MTIFGKTWAHFTYLDKKNFLEKLCTVSFWILQPNGHLPAQS